RQNVPFARRGIACRAKENAPDSSAGTFVYLLNVLLNVLGIQRGRPQRDVGAIAQGDGHAAGLALDLHMAEELHAVRRRQVLLVEAGRLDELHLGAERVVEFVRTESAGVERPGDEFPEWLEILELRLVRIVVMRRGVVHVRR